MERRIADRDMMFPDRRRMRAQAVTGYILRALEPWLDRLDRIEPEAKHRRRAYQSLFDLLYATGVEVITEQDRAAAGLSPRNEFGLTDQEMQIMEQRYMDALLRPTPVILPFAPQNTPATECQTPMPNASNGPQQDQ